MDNTDRQRFKTLLDTTSEYYQSKSMLSPGAMQLYFAALKRFDFDQVQEAIGRHIQDTGAGQYYPKVADIVKHIEGEELTADQIIAAARIGKTPLGILCRIHIGSWNLKHADTFLLRQLGEECRQLAPEWRDKAMRGEYSTHEMETMLKYEVNPADPFSEGLAAPKNSEALQNMARRIAAQQEQLEPPQDPPQELQKDDKLDPGIARYVDKIMREVNQ